MAENIEASVQEFDISESPLKLGKRNLTLFKKLNSGIK